MQTCTLLWVLESVPRYQTCPWIKNSNHHHLSQNQTSTTSTTTPLSSFWKPTTSFSSLCMWLWCLCCWCLLISFSVLNSRERKHFRRFLHQSLVCSVKYKKNEKYWFLRCEIWEILEWRKKMKIWVSSSFSKSWKGFCYQFRPSPTWTSHVSSWQGKTKRHMIRFNRS